MSDALHDHADIDDQRRRKKRQLRSWNERDEWFANHPTKVKYRDLNREATNLFLKARKDTKFFDHFSKREVVDERDEKFQESLLFIYKRSRHNTAISPALITSMQSANLALKKEHLHAIKRLSR